MNSLIILIVTLAFSHAELAFDTTTLSQLSEEFTLGTDDLPQENSEPVTVSESILETRSSFIPEDSSKSESYDIPKVSGSSYEDSSEESATVSSENFEQSQSSQVVPATEKYTEDEGDKTKFAVPPHTDQSSYVTVVNRVPSVDQDATIVHQENIRRMDGSYQTDYQTSNGISFHEEGVPRNYNTTDVESGKTARNIVVKGAYEWTAPNGQKIAIKYYADETGFHPEGSVLPTPPPTPPEILKALALIRKLQAAAKEKELKAKEEHSDN